MFDNLRDAVEQPEESPKLRKKVIRFRWPIYLESEDDDDPLQAKLAEFIQRGEMGSLEVQKSIYITRAFVRDPEGKEYTTRVPEFFSKYKLTKPKKK